MWVFVRVEWEVVKKAQEGRQNGRIDEGSGDEGELEMMAIPEDSNIHQG